MHVVPVVEIQVQCLSVFTRHAEWAVLISYCVFCSLD